MNFYEEMMRDLGEYHTGNGQGPAMVEIADRETPLGTNTIIRVAFQDDNSVYELRLYNFSQVKQLARAILEYVDRSGGLKSLLEKQRWELVE